MKTRTDAAIVSARLGDNGLQFTDATAAHLEDIASDAGARRQQHPRKPDTYRLVFPDGSVITVAGDAWDDGFPNCWCWAGAGHSDDCSEIPA